MNHKDLLDKAIAAISITPSHVAFEIIHGYTRQTYDEYQGTKFEADLFLAQELVLKYGMFELYEHANSWSPSKVFMDTFTAKAEEGYDDVFFDGYGALQYDLPEYQLRLRIVNGQGTVYFISSTAE
jgi:hypothetical protein